MPLNTWFDGGDETKTIPRERVFRVKRSYPKILRNRKRRIQRRLDPERGWSDQSEPIMRASNIHYEMAEKARAVNCGGIGAIHLMVNKLGLRQEIDSRLQWVFSPPWPVGPFAGRRSIGTGSDAFPRRAWPSRSCPLFGPC